MKGKRRGILVVWLSDIKLAMEGAELLLSRGVTESIIAVLDIVNTYSTTDFNFTVTGICLCIKRLVQ